MLNFFRKYQKFVFILIAIVLVLSCSVFGTYSAFSNSGKTSDKQVGKTIDGSPIMQSDRAALIHFLETSAFDRDLLFSGKMANLLNDGFIEKEFLMTGLADHLMTHHFEEMKEQLEPRWKRAQNFRAYRHPHSPDLSAEKMWELFSPHLSLHLDAMKGAGEFSPASFAHLKQLYLDQLALPSDMMRRVLLFQEKQGQLPKDPILERGNLALFGFHSLEEWFGEPFIEKVADFVINAAAVAEQKGYRVTDQEVYTELQRTFSQSIDQLKMREELGNLTMAQYFNAIGMRDTQVLSAARKVMLFKRLFDDSAHSVLVDPLFYKNFKSYSSEAMIVDLYELPPELRLKDFSALLKLQLYIDAVSANTAKQKALLSLPKTFLSIEEVARRCPELVERRYRLEIAEVQKDQLALQVGLKDTWNWQAEDQNWDLLIRTFPTLAMNGATSREHRAEILDQLDTEQRLEIDAFARNKIVDAHPERIDEALTLATPQTRDMGLSSRSKSSPFKGAGDSAALSLLLDAAALKEETAPSEKEAAAREKLQRYSGDGVHFYRIAILERAPQQEILTFAQASTSGVLDQLLDQRLEQAYPDLRKKNPSVFKKENGGWRSFQEVKEQVGALLYPDLLKAIDESRPEALDIYAHKRLSLYMADAKKALEGNPDNPAWVRVAGIQTTPLADQWRLIKSTKTVKRGGHEPFVQGDILAMQEGKWSPVSTPASGALTFFHALERTHSDRVDQSEVNHVADLLGKEVRTQLFHQILDQMK